MAKVNTSSGMIQTLSLPMLVGAVKTPAMKDPSMEIYQVTHLS